MQWLVVGNDPDNLLLPSCTEQRSLHSAFLLPLQHVRWHCGQQLRAFRRAKLHVVRQDSGCGDFWQVSGSTV